MSTSAVLLNQAEQQYLVNVPLSFPVEPNSPLTIEQVQKRTFAPIGADKVDFGHTDQVHWLRFLVENRVARQQPDWVLRVMSLSSTVCDLYLIDPNGQVRQWPTGIRLPFHRRPFDALPFDFPLTLCPMRAPGLLTFGWPVSTHNNTRLIFCRPG